LHSTRIPEPGRPRPLLRRPVAADVAVVAAAAVVLLLLVLLLLLQWGRLVKYWLIS